MISKQRNFEVEPNELHVLMKNLKTRQIDQLIIEFVAILLVKILRFIGECL